MTKEEAIMLADSGWDARCTHQEIVALQLYEERLVVSSFDIFHEALEKSVGRPIQTLEFGLDINRLRSEFEKQVPDADKLIERMRQAKDRFVQSADHRRIYHFQSLTKDIVGQTLSTEFMETEEFACVQTDGMPARFCYSLSEKKAWLELPNSKAIDPWDRPRLENKCVDYGIRDCDSMEAAQQMLKELGYEPILSEYNAPAHQREGSQMDMNMEM